MKPGIRPALTPGLIILFLVVLFPSCKENHQILCTEEYRMITVSVKDSNSHPVHLFWYNIRKKSTGESFSYAQEDPYQDSINRRQGIYTIFTDGKMGMTTKEGMEFEFLIMKGSMPVVLETYMIGKDDCHVLLYSGKTEITY